jgi:hypothetical protein
MLNLQPRKIYNGALNAMQKPAGSMLVVNLNVVVIVHCELYKFVRIPFKFLIFLIFSSLFSSALFP